ncbi:MAG: ElyC/SanA/YdcF family protein [Propionicimonas sp.]|uniref:ElyC/SanA/YdcF family protein n=1 Tax=Propionicimonas sp. TaxID=1955623 RepID=UPI002B1F37DB|nr:ElyC/SanA/YdcF family protein [Propionicimonas sp.]MEA4944350.1 ElyC/SanA/YdcF family protein [Propionicimonas sp.]
MKWISTARGTVAVTLAVLLAFAGPGQAQAASSTSLAESKAQAIYFQSVSNTAQRDLALASISASSDWSGTLWKEFLTTWGSINKAMAMNNAVPSGLPTKGHVFVVLGSALSSSGTMTTTLERRLKLAVKALAAYPASKVVVTGGKPKQGNTEAAVMRTWLIDHGVASSRILTEDKSSNTINNAKNTMAILSGLTQYTSYTLITDAGHMRRSSVLFRAATIQIEEKKGKRWAIKPVSNLAYPDMVAGKVPLSASSVAYTAGEVASLFGVSTEYKKVLANPPKLVAAKPPATVALSSLSLTSPKKLSYQLGAKPSTSGMVVTARYSNSATNRVVTSKAKVTGFSTSKVGKAKATVSYTEGGVTKTASFSYKVTKATSKVTLKPSTTKPKRSKTRVVLKATITTGASKVVPTGTVKFYLDGKKLKTVSLTKAKKGTVSFTYPTITKIGSHKLTLKYSGTSKLTAASKTVTVKVAT